MMRVLQERFWLVVMAFAIVAVQAITQLLSEWKDDRRVQRQRSTLPVGK
jgi:hypothetical protein